MIGGLWKRGDSRCVVVRTSERGKEKRGKKVKEELVTSGH